MTFEEWLNTKLPLAHIGKKALALEAWEAATKVEREDCIAKPREDTPALLRVQAS